MSELTREEKLKLLGKLSPLLQDLMTSEDTGAALLYLGQKYNLSDHQVRLLSKILGDVVLGVLPVTNLPLEISTKAAVDMQTASGLAQDLNDLILYPKPEAAVPTPTPITPTPVAPSEVPALKPIPIAPTPKTDIYRESISGMPEIVDLRKNPPPQIQMPVSAAPIPPSPRPAPPLIEANPHKIQEEKILERTQFIMRPPGLAPIPTFKVGTPTPDERGVGADTPNNVLDLRKDKGEF